MKHYVLDGENHIQEETDIVSWALWFENLSNRSVGYTQINSVVNVSTVFLGIDHGLDLNGLPLLFETMVFGLDNDYCTRYFSWDDAKLGHKLIVAKVRKQLKYRKVEA